MYLLLALLLLQAIGANAGRVTTSIELSGPVQTPNNLINEVVFVLPTVLPKKEDVPLEIGTTIPLTIEWRYLALLALPLVIAPIVIAIVKFREYRIMHTGCQCRRCRYLLFHTCEGRRKWRHCCDNCAACISWRQPRNFAVIGEDALDASPDAADDYRPGYLAQSIPLNTHGISTARRPAGYH